MSCLRCAVNVGWTGIVGAILILASVTEADSQPQSAVAPSAEQQDPAGNWDRVFRHLELPEVDESKEFVAHCVNRLLSESLLDPGSKVLALAMGEGRNAIYMADKGLDVTGIDISSVAIERAEQAAARRGVEITAVKADLIDYDLGQGEWDMVTNIYFNPSIWIFDQIKKAVRPGGFLLVEGYGADFTGAGPPIWSRYKPNQLVEELSGWRILEYQDGIFPCIWEGGKSIPVVRLLARKPLQKEEP